MIQHAEEVAGTPTYTAPTPSRSSERFWNALLVSSTETPAWNGMGWCMDGARERTTQNFRYDLGHSLPETARRASGAAADHSRSSHLARATRDLIVPTGHEQISAASA